MVSLLVDKQQTMTDEEKEKKAKKEKGGKEVGGAGTKSHGLEGLQLTVCIDQCSVG